MFSEKKKKALTLIFLKENDITGTCISNYYQNFEKCNPLFKKGTSMVLAFSDKINVLNYTKSRKSVLVIGKTQNIILGF